jgi:Spy/CpxP family protein refolding chaperone
MKKILVVVSAVMVALVIFGAGFVFAQSNVAQAAGLPAGYGPGNMMGGRGGMMGGRGNQGQMQDYVEQALADKLGMTKVDVETALDGGKTMYQLTIDKGTKEADVAALLTDVHKTAFAKAVSDGILTQAQADTMLQNMTTNGFNSANGPMQNGGAGRGMRGGRGQGGMMGGWNQQPTTTP